MAEEVEISNVGGNGVASEATLARLVATMEAMSRRGGGSGGGGAKTQKAYNDAQKSGITVVTKNRDALKSNTNQVKKHSQALKSAISGLTSLGGAVLGQVVGSLNNLADVALGSSTDLKSFAETVPFVGKYLGILAGTIDNNTAAFRTLSQQGVLLGEGIMGMTRASASAGLPLEEFVGLIQDNAHRMQMFGATSAQAATTFATMSKQFRDGPGKQLMSMGYSVSDLNELLLDYAEYQDMQLGIQSRADNVSLKSAAEYGEQLNELAAITGKNRKQIADEMKQRMADSRQQQALGMMDADQKENFERVQAMAGKFGPMMSEAVLDMSDGIPTKDSVAASLMPMSETFRDQAKNLKNMSRKEQEQFFVTVNAEAAEYKKKFGKSYQAVIAAGGPMADAFRASMEIAKARVTTEKELEDEAIRIAKEVEKDNAIKNFQATIMNLRAKFEEIFFAENGPLSKLTTYFGTILEKLQSQENLDKFEAAVRAAADTLVKFFEKVETMVMNINKYDIKTALFGAKKGTKTADGTVVEEDVEGIFGDINGDGSLTSLLGSAIGGVISSTFDGWEIPWGTLFVGGLVGIGAAIAAPVLAIPAGIAAAITAIFGIELMKDLLGDAWDALKAAFTWTAETAGWLLTGISGLFSTAWESITGFFDFGEAGFSITALMDKAWGVVTGYFDFAGQVWTGIGGLFDAAWTKVTGWMGFGDKTWSLSDIFTGAWETVTSFFSLDNFDMPSISDMFQGIIDSVKGFFTFDFTMPNFRDFLPTWLGGKGKEIGDGSLPPEMETKVAERIPDANDAVAKAGVLQEAKQAVATIIDVPTLKNALTAIKEGMNTNQVKSYAEALQDVAEQLIAINEAASDQKTTVVSRRGTRTVDQKSAAAGVLDGSSPFGQNSQTGSLDTLNTTMLAILEELQSQTPSIKKTAKETSGNVATSVIPSSN